MTTRTMALLGAGMLLFTTSTISAQDAPPAGAPPRPRAEGRPAPRPDAARVRGPGRAGGGAPAAMLLAMRDRLALTDEQVRRLEALAATQREALRPNEPAMLRARADLMEAERRDDVAAVRAALERASRLRIDATVARLQARKAARDVLTAEQRTRLDDGRGMMMQRVRGDGMRDRGMRGPRRPMGPRVRPEGMGIRERRSREF